MISVNILIFLRALEVSSHKCDRLVMALRHFSAAVSIKHLRLPKAFKVAKCDTCICFPLPYMGLLDWEQSVQLFGRKDVNPDL